MVWVDLFIYQEPVYLNPYRLTGLTCLNWLEVRNQRQNIDDVR